MKYGGFMNLKGDKIMGILTKSDAVCWLKSDFTQCVVHTEETFYTSADDWYCIYWIIRVNSGFISVMDILPDEVPVQPEFHLVVSSSLEPTVIYVYVDSLIAISLACNFDITWLYIKIAS